jgi:pyruvate/2-oxoglutarate/acetoin dehydrogenase E1 component
LATQDRSSVRRQVGPLSADPSRLCSVRKTGRAVLVDEVPKFAVAGVEAAAAVQELAFGYLDLPVGRFGAIRTTMPENPRL